MPQEVARAVEIEEIAQRYHVLPTAVADAPAWLRNHFRLLKLIEAGLDDGGGDD